MEEARCSIHQRGHGAPHQLRLNDTRRIIRANTLRHVPRGAAPAVRRASADFCGGQSPLLVTFAGKPGQAVALRRSRLRQILLQKSPQRSCKRKIRNNGIGTNGFLNQRCALAPDLESILRARMSKIVFQQYRSKPEELKVSTMSPVSLTKRTPLRL